ncbi:MAG: addiction module protein [Desulfococcaceae bacterium]|jgi:putative addiction module component (TIGR02574 family)|nr:addiction module protein [Desulfococcaceae bacterium]
MRHNIFSEILKLPIEERIQLVQDIWDSIAADVQETELTEAEKQITDERPEACHRNPEAGSSWEEVHKRITSGYDL